jgi:outer membrane protein assembly factor BamB
LAYKADTGDLAWKTSSGTHSYSSPHVATFDGKKQVLFLSDLELTSLDPATGRALWRFESTVKAGQGFPVVQPHLVGPSEVLVSFSSDTGSMLLKVAHDGEDWKVLPQWKSKGEFNPYFNDFVVYKDSVYGFEAPLFCCVDAQTGKRLWKKGRYGAGEVLLLADQGVLLVITEKGEAVLVDANREKHRELGRFQAINGKTWNHPTIVDGRLYLRNAEEMACYELSLE